jgi:hypothetical protein
MGKAKGVARKQRKEVCSRPASAPLRPCVCLAHRAAHVAPPAVRRALTHMRHRLSVSSVCVLACSQRKNRCKKVRGIKKAKGK